jgi:hypothetical protein
MITRFLSVRSLRAALLVGSLCALSFAANAQSQMARASVPFDFAAGGVMMPAGEYTVDVLRGSSGNSAALLTTFSGTIPEITTAKLNFERRDGMVYLSSVAWPGQTARVMSMFKHVTKGTVAAKLR